MADRDASTRTWRIVCIAGVILTVVCAALAAVLGATTGRILAATPEDLVPVEDAGDLFTGLEPGQTLYLYASEGTDIVHGPAAAEAAGGDAGGDVVERRPPQGWPGGCEVDGPDMQAYHRQTVSAPIDVGGEVHEPVLTLMNGSAPNASYTVECRSEDLLVGTPDSSTEFQVHGLFWPALAFGVIGVGAAIVGGAVLTVRRRGSASGR